MNIIQKIEHYIKNEVHNPLSTMTNLAYILIGYLRLAVNPWIGMYVIAVGIASTGFHWTRRDAWHKLDIVAIYYLFAAIAGWLWLGDWGILLGHGVGMLAHWSFNNYSRYSFTIIGILGGLCIIPYWLQWGTPPTLYMLMWFALAFAVQRLAEWFDPAQDGKWYDVWHGSWHLFSSIGIYYLIKPAAAYVATYIAINLIWA